MSGTETVCVDGSTAVSVDHVEELLKVRRTFSALVALQLGELVRVARRVPVRGVREVVELQHLCSGRTVSQRQIALHAGARMHAGRLRSLPDRTWPCGIAEESG